MPNDPQPPNRVIRFKDVCEEVGVNRRTFERMLARGEGPKVLRMSPRCVGVRRSDLEAWLAEREDMRGPQV